MVFWGLEIDEMNLLGGWWLVLVAKFSVKFFGTEDSTHSLQTFFP
jgi:hypothetical protein